MSCYSSADGKPVDATQELLATGLCNIGNSFFHAYPGSGSFSRCAVTAASGVRSPMEGLYAGENSENSIAHSASYSTVIFKCSFLFESRNSQFFLGILVIFALLFCTPYLYYIPKAALAAIIIAAVIFMVEVRVVRPIYRSKSKNMIYV